jgi:hypothetical protein
VTTPLAMKSNSRGEHETAASASNRSQDTSLKHFSASLGSEKAEPGSCYVRCGLSVHAKIDMFSRSSISANHGVHTANAQVGTGALDVRTDHRLLISCSAFGTASVSHEARVSSVRFAGSTAAEDSS